MSGGLLKLRDYQAASIAALHTDWSAGNTRVAAVLPTGAGKGHPLDTEVPTPDGLRRWGDLKPGDRVFGSDGVPTEVTAVYDRGVLPTYRVTFSDGASVEVDGDHLWAVRDGERRRTSRERGVIDTRSLRGSNLRMTRGYRWHIPIAAPVARRRADLPLDPYVVGALIANGGMTGVGTILTTPDPDVAKWVNVATECNKIDDATPGICDRYSLPGLTGVTRALGMRVRSSEKRIPRLYLESSREQRVGLLHGLMDGDGSARDSFRRSVNYSTTSAGLADDMVELVTSLGGTANLRTSVRQDRVPEYTVGILMPSGIEPFGTVRKRGGEAGVRNLQPRRAIVSIEPVGEKPIRCITVAAENSLYLITRQHIVTHNTVVFSHLIAEWLAANPGRRVLILVHTEELVMQAYRKLREVAPHLSVGIVKAARNQVTADVIIACVPSLRSARRRAQLRRIGLIVTDECHHAAAPTYRKIYAHFGALAYDGTDAAPEYRDAVCGECADAIDSVEADTGERLEPSRGSCPNSGCPYGKRRSATMAGYTATLARGDNMKLSEIWQSVAYRKDIGFMIRRGYLRDVRGKRIEIPEFDLSKVKKSGGDYQASDLGEALEASLAPEIVAEAIAEHAAGRSGVAFWPTVSAAYAGADAMNAAGVKTEVVHGGLAPAERREILARLERGDTQWVSNCMVLTEGFDCPRVSVVAVCRPTRSAPLYQQMVGRGLRLWCPEHGGRARIKPEPCCEESITEALILDVVGASRTHGLASLVDLSEKDLRELPDDMTLTEAEEFEDEAGSDAPIKLVHDGPVESVDFDPLDRASQFVWNRTPEGIWFLSVGANDGRYVFLLPSTYVDPETGESAGPDTWDVIWASKSAYGAHREQGATEHRGISQEAAFAWAEDVADDLKMNAGFGAINTTSKRATWRRQPASQAQLDQLRRRKIPMPEGKVAPGARAERVVRDGGVDAAGMRFDIVTTEARGDVLTKGEASILIDAHAAGQRIDPIARWAASYRS